MHKKHLFVHFLILGLLFFNTSAFAKIENDRDKDGLSDYEELYVYKTNLDKLDTDDDGAIETEKRIHC